MKVGRLFLAGLADQGFLGPGDFVGLATRAAGTSLTTTARPEPPEARPTDSEPAAIELKAPRSRGWTKATLRAGSWRRTVQPYLILADVVALVLAAWLSAMPRWPDATALLVTALLCLGGAGTYRSRLSLSVLDDLPAVVVAALLGGVAQLGWLTAVGHEPSGPTLLQRVAVATALLALGRLLAYAVVRHARRVGLVQHRTLILGTGDVGRQIAEAMVQHPEYGLRAIGMLDARLEGSQDLPVPVVGRYADLSRIIRRERVSEVVVAFLDDSTDAEPGSPHHDTALVEAVRACDRLGCEIFCVPRLYELHRRSRDMDELWGIPLIRAHRATWRSPSWPIKRLVDVVVAVVALLLLAPLMGLIALAVRLEVGSVLFRQERVGLDGERFMLLKFRSLRLAEGAEGRVVWSINQDPRLGRVGRLIRGTSLDELPQLINILRGEMSLVGPRPERPVFVDHFTERFPRYTARHRTPAGLTGWAQVNGLRGDTSIEERVRFDNYYIQNWSLWFDLKILARTLGSVLLRRGS